MSLMGTTGLAEFPTSSDSLEELEMMFEEAKFEDGDLEQMTYKASPDLLKFCGSKHPKLAPAAPNIPD